MLYWLGVRPPGQLLEQVKLKRYNPVAQKVQLFAVPLKQ